MTQVDPRRMIPRTDSLLALPHVQQARRGDSNPEDVEPVALAGLTTCLPISLHHVLDATEAVAARVRAGDLPVLARVHGGGCLVDLRSVPASDDALLVGAAGTALIAGEVGGR